MSAEVDAFIAALAHPLKAELQTLRALILAADPAIDEGIKWNAPSFRRRDGEWFATFHLRAKTGLQLILHRGAKKRAEALASAAAIDDPAALLEWLGDDRATVKFRDVADIETKRQAFVALLREWMRHV